MEGLSNWILRRRKLIGLVWLVVAIAGVVVAPSVSSRMRSGAHFSSPTSTATQAIATRYAGAASDPGVLVLNLPRDETVRSAAAARELGSIDRAVEAAAPRDRVVSYASTRSVVLVGNRGRSSIVLVFPPTQASSMDASAMATVIRAAEAAAPALTVHGTSLAALASGKPGTGSSSVLGELLVGALGALAALAWVFGSLLAFLPLLTGLLSVLTMQLLIYGLTDVLPSSLPINPSVQFIVALLGLGMSIDYSLLVVTRWREERVNGLSNADAVRSAMVRSGHSVWFSGIVASLGLCALVVVPDSIVRGIGITGLFIPSTAMLVALTLLPTVLSTVGPLLDWPRRRSAGRASRFWTWWVAHVIRHRVAAAIFGLAVLGGLAGMATTITVAQPTSRAIATSGTPTEGLHALVADGFPTGVLTPVPIYVPRAADASTVVSRLDRVPGLRGAVAPDLPAWRKGGSALVVALPTGEVGSSDGATSLANIESTVPSGALVGGEAAMTVAEAHADYSNLALLVGIVALVTFLLLARALKSLLLPAKAVVLNALSVAASCGIVAIVFQHGVGMQALWGARSYGAVDALAPVLIFGFLFGVSMDYEVFILSRVREGFERTGSTGDGIVEGIARTGRLVTSAAAILFFALASLSTTGNPVVREVAAGLAGGVLLDALVVRMLLLPALVSLFGRANWWMPARVERLLGISDRLVAQGTQPAHVPVRVGDEVAAR